MNTSIHARSASTGGSSAENLLLCLSQLLDFGDVDSGQQIIARSREVTIQRTWTDPGELGDLVHAGVHAASREDPLGHFQDAFTVPLSVGAWFSGHRLLRGWFIHRMFLKPETTLR